MHINKVGTVFKEVARAVVAALVIVAIMKGSMVEANQIVSSSMLPTLLEGDFILVNKLKYGFSLPFTHKKLLSWGTPERGDVVTFFPPSGGEKVFIKRIVAIEGDTVKIANSMLYINGREIETFKSASDSSLFREFMGDKGYSVVKHNPDYSFGPVTVPVGDVFAVGDNRDLSHDSRAFGPLPIKNIEGKAEFIYFTKTISSGVANLKRIGNFL
ncbi:Signal peptidase I [hydrothermal vent metagenome]|uniref:Signal peptidase I n=1 Tax=hydrothermal vent metagenome TaxID=652676 RepID=A0A3B1CFH7_9ZZZZ